MHTMGIVNSAIFTALSGNSTLNTYVGGRFSPNVAPGGETVPYITYRYAFGGELNNTPKPAFEIFVDIVGVADTQPKAAVAAGYIRDILKNVLPVFPAASGYQPWGTVRESWPIQNTMEVQGQPFWEVGSTYRFRGYLP